MQMHERIRELRKKHLKLSQTAFGEKLGVSRSVINNIESNVLARPEQKLSLIKLMCKEFHVNENWILHGEEPIFVTPEALSLDEFAKSKGATALDIQIVKTYLELDPEIRQKTLEHFKKHLLIWPIQSTGEAKDAASATDTASKLVELEQRYQELQRQNQELQQQNQKLQQHNQETDARLAALEEEDAQAAKSDTQSLNWISSVFGSSSNTT